MMRMRRFSVLLLGIAAELLSKYGATVIAVSDSRAGILNRAGLDVPALLEHKAKTGSVANFANSDAISSEALLELDCDILIPAAVENQITSRNADRVKAHIICEGANGPTTAEADDILADKRVFVIPDILANSGGVTVSYFGWVQDRQGYFWQESEVNDQLDHIMRASFAEVSHYAETQDVSNRIAAYMLAVDRVAYTLRQRGIYA